MEGRQPPGGVRRRLTVLAAIAAGSVATAGCGRQSPLDPGSGPARDVSTLWWWLFAVAGLFFLGTVFLLLASWALRTREGIPRLGKSPTLTTTLVVAFGIVVPLFVLVAVFVVSDLVVIKKTEAPKAATTAMTVEVIGRQWFWEVRYRGSTAVTANEIHIPTRTRVNLVGRTADVIHSFWVPQLNRKIDTTPGKDEPHPALRGQARPLPGHVLRVLRASARPHGDVRVRRPTGPVQSLACPDGAAGREPGNGRRAPR